MPSPPTTTPWVPMWPLEAATPPDVEGIPADVVVPAANHLISNKYAAGDANYGYVLYADGKQVFGDGAASVDVGLYRSAPATLRIGPLLEVEQSLVIGKVNNAYLNMPQDHARIYMGVASDTTLYRSAAGVLKTDGEFRASGSIYAASGAAGQIILGADGKVYFGTAGDTNLYRSSAGVLKTDGNLDVGGASITNGMFSVVYGRATTRQGGPDQIQIGDRSGDGATAQISFGSAADTNLYRAAAGQLKTDGGFYAVGQSAFHWTGAAWAVTTVASPGAGVAFEGDTLLYRHAANEVKAAGYLYAGQAIYAYHGHATLQSGFVAVDGLYPGVSAGGDVLFRAGAGRMLTRSVLGSSHGGHWSYLGSAYTGENAWMGGYWAASMFWDGTNWVNETGGGNNGWAMWACEGAGGGVSFYSEPNSGAVQRTYTPAQMQTKRLLRIDNAGQIVFKDGTVMGTAAAKLPMAEAYRASQTAVAYAYVTFEANSILDPGFNYSAQSIQVANMGWYRISVRSNFSGGTGDGYQAINIRHISSVGAVVQEYTASYRNSTNNGWNMSQTGSMVIQMQVAEHVAMICDGAATGTPGNYNTACMSVERIR